MKPVSQKSNATLKEVLTELKSLANKDYKAKMEHFALPTQNAYGISLPELRRMSKALRYNHELALQLWDTKITEARIVAAFIDDASLVPESQLEKWVHEFDSWGICDGCCSELFVKTSFAYLKANEWSYSEKEFVKRAGFVMMAEIAMHRKKDSDKNLLPFFKRMEEEAHDGRNFVRKAVNWALRQTGKRSVFLHGKAIACAQRIQKQNSSTAKWIANDALRELHGEVVKRKLEKLAAKKKV